MDRGRVVSITKFLALLVFLCIAAALLMTTSCANAAGAERAKRVLMISTGSRISPGFGAYERSFAATLQELAPARSEFYSEYLDIVRFPSES
jgi:hypothetical protein